jgi:hypothetical protein
MVIFSSALQWIFNGYTVTGQNSVVKFSKKVESLEVHSRSDLLKAGQN